MNELHPRVSLEKLKKTEPPNRAPQERVVYRRVSNAEMRNPSKVVVTFPIIPPTETDRPDRVQIIPTHIQDASIKELSVTIDSLRDRADQESLRDLLILIRRGKAIEKASEYKYGRSNDTLIGESIGKSPHIGKLIREGQRDLSSIELYKIRDTLEPNADDTFAEKIQAVNDYIEWKEDKERISGIGDLLANLRKSTGATQGTFAQVLQKSPRSLREIEQNTLGISVGNAKKLRDTAQERRKEYEEALSVLKIDSKEMKERMTESRAIRNLRNELSVKQSEIAEATGDNQTHIRRVEQNESHIARAKMSGVISFFSEKGAVFDSVEIQFLLLVHEGKVQQKRSRWTGVELAELTGYSQTTISKMLSESVRRGFSIETLATFIEKVDGLLPQEKITLLENKLREMLDTPAKKQEPQERKKRPGTQKYLALRTGFSRDTVHKIWNNEEVSEETLATFIKKAGRLLPQEKITSLEATLKRKREETLKKTPRTRVANAIREAGKIYGEIISDIKETSGDTIAQIEESMAENVGISSTTFKNFRLGLIQEPNATVILKALSYYLTPEDHRYMAIKEIFEIRAELEKKWLRTFTQEGMTSNKATRYLRLSTGLYQSGFSQSTNVPIQTIKDIEFGHDPSPYTLNQFVNATSLKHLGEDSKPLQLLRLIISGEKPRSLEELQKISGEKLERYLRILKGDTQIEVRKRRRETGDSVGAFIKYLDLSTETNAADKALAEIITETAKGLKKRISTDTYQEALWGKYLFAKQLEKISPPQLSSEEETLIEGKSTGEVLREIRTNQNISLVQLAKMVPRSRTRIGDIELGNSIPEDVTVVVIMNGLGYDIHHPLTQKLLDRAEEERKAA